MFFVSDGPTCGVCKLVECVGHEGKPSKGSSGKAPEGVEQHDNAAAWFPVALSIVDSGEFMAPPEDGGEELLYYRGCGGRDPRNMNLPTSQTLDTIVRHNP